MSRHLAALQIAPHSVMISHEKEPQKMGAMLENKAQRQTRTTFVNIRRQFSQPDPGVQVRLAKSSARRVDRTPQFNALPLWVFVNVCEERLGHDDPQGGLRGFRDIRGACLLFRVFRLLHEFVSWRERVPLPSVHTRAAHSLWLRLSQVATRPRPRRRGYRCLPPFARGRSIGRGFYERWSRKGSS